VAHSGVGRGPPGGPESATVYTEFAELLVLWVAQTLLQLISAVDIVLNCTLFIVFNLCLFVSVADYALV